MRDLLDSAHEVARVKALGDKAELDAAPDQIERLQALAETQSMGQLTRLWQMLLKAYDEVRLAPDPLTAAEMSVIRLCVSADLPPPEWAAQLLSQLGDAPAAASTSAPIKSGGNGGAQAMRKPAPAPATQTVSLTSLEAIAEHAKKLGQKAFAADIRRCMRLISFTPGKIVFDTVELAPTQLVPQLKDKLKAWTGEDWHIIVETAPPGTETLRETAQREKAEQEAADDAHPAILEMARVFPGAKRVEIRDVRPKSAQIIDGKFPQKDK